MIQSNSAGQEHEKVALFPGYLFIRINLNEEISSHWKWVAGVRYVVAYGDRPVAVPESLIETLQSEIVHSEAVGRSTRGRFRDGEAIRIVKGPFAELLAIFEGPTSAEQRVTVLLEFMGRICRIRVDEDQLEPTTVTIPDQRQKWPRRSRGRGRSIKPEFS